MEGKGAERRVGEGKRVEKVRGTEKESEKKTDGLGVQAEEEGIGGKEGERGKDEKDIEERRRVHAEVAGREKEQGREKVRGTEKESEKKTDG